MAEETAEYDVSYPTTLYYQRADGMMLSQVFTDEREYTAARKAGWHSSPAAFGVETHPSQPGMAALTAQVMPIGAPPPGDLAEMTALLLALQAQQEATAHALQALTTRVAHLEHPPAATHPAETHPPQVARTGPHPGTHTPEDDKPSTAGRK